MFFILCFIKTFRKLFPKQKKLWNIYLEIIFYKITFYKILFKNIFISSWTRCRLFLQKSINIDICWYQSKNYWYPIYTMKRTKLRKSMILRNLGHHKHELSWLCMILWFFHEVHLLTFMTQKRGPKKEAKKGSKKGVKKGRKRGG